MVDRREFLSLIGSAAIASALDARAAWAARPPRKPNFLVILADDMGFSDAGCYGGEIDTPNIDRLGANGLRFTQAYSTARCGPSRACLLTGYYAQQTASDVMTPGKAPDWTRFIPEYLKPLGYRSYHSGKWHIKFKPLEGVGFDHSYTMLDEDRYFTQKHHQLDGEPLPTPKPEDHYYSTTAIADYGIHFLKGHAQGNAQDPFFLYLAFHSPHFPLQALAEDIDGYRDRFAEGWDVVRERRWERMHRMGIVNCALAPLEPDVIPPWNWPEKRLVEKIGSGEVAHAVPWSSLTLEQKRLQRTKMAIHAAMITRMDAEIGKVVKQLKAMDALNDTVILFLSDNGASAEQIIRGDGHDPLAAPGSANTFLCVGPGWGTAANTPLRLHKSYLQEGGISSPLVVHWPNGIKDHGKLRHNPCHFVDVLPTLMDLGGSPTADRPSGAPPFPGKSLTPAFMKDGTVQHEYLYFNHAGHRAIRAADWKLIDMSESVPWELYDLGTDRCEQNDLGSVHPDQVRQLSAMWKVHDDDYIRTRESSPPSKKPLLMRTG